MFIEYNPNPVGRYDVGDCAIRAISKALNESWEDSFIRLSVAAYAMGDLPNSDAVFGSILRMRGFYKKTIPDTCPNCYTLGDFAYEHPKGVYVVGTGSHVVTVIDGDIYDTTDSSKAIPVYYWYLDNNKQENTDDATKQHVLLSTSAVPTAATGNTAAATTPANGQPAASK